LTPESSDEVDYQKSEHTIENEKPLKNRWVILYLMVMCPFVSTLNSSITNVGLPVISDSLQVSTSAVNWIVTAYLIVTSSTILFFGRLGDMIGNTRVLQGGMLTFTIGSLLCGLSPNFGLLIAARILQAVGSGAVMANNHGIITRTFPKNERGRALGINGAFVALGTMTGPSIGGLILTFADWKYLFLINVPVGGLIFLLQQRFLPKEERKKPGVMDYPGAVLFFSFIAALFAALQQVQALGISHPFVVICLVVSAISFIFFLRRQLRYRFRLLDLSIFKNKWFSISLFCAFTSYLAIQSANLVLPFYLQDVLFFSPGLSGLYMTIYPLVLMMVSPVSGYLSDRIGAESITLAGIILTGGGLFLISTLDDKSPNLLLILFISIMAVGNGMFQSPNNSLVMSSVPGNIVGVGGSINALVRNIGQNFGVVLATLLLYNGISATLGYHVTDYAPGNPEAFANGMRITFQAVGAICLAGAVLTALRLIGFKHEKKRSVEFAAAPEKS